MGKYYRKGGRFEEITLEEFKRFLACLLYMGIVKVPDMKNLWTHKFFPQREGVRAILAALQVHNYRVANKQDPLYKIRPIYNHMLEVCPSLFTPFQNISVDERMVKSKARVFFKQYICNKPTKWGFKLWVIAYSLSAYTLDMVVYTGSGKRGNILRDVFALEGLTGNGGEDCVAPGFSAQMMEQVGANVVIKLCQPYFNLNHVL